VHVAVAWATDVVQTLPHVLQFAALDVVSTHIVWLQIVGAVDGQPVAHWYCVPDPAQSGAPASHALSHPPQWLAVVMSVSHP
jgi:hypothetical protein